GVLDVTDSYLVPIPISLNPVLKKRPDIDSALKCAGSARGFGVESAPVWWQDRHGPGRVRTPHRPVLIERWIAPHDLACRALALGAVGRHFRHREPTTCDFPFDLVLVLPRPRREVGRHDDVEPVVPRVEAA